MANISVRVDDELKKEMEQLKHVNWSEVVRKAIQDYISQKNHRNLGKAVLLTEKIRKTAPADYDSASVIREWRDKRN
ncbi:MAG: antitoxin [Candidatus Heimdallarchaeota archaeon]